MKENHKQQKPGVGASEASGFPFPALERVWLRAGLQHWWRMPLMMWVLTPRTSPKS